MTLAAYFSFSRARKSLLLAVSGQTNRSLAFRLEKKFRSTLVTFKYILLMIEVKTALISRCSIFHEWFVT